MTEGERLQKVLAHAGVASRRTIEEMIVAGRIKVNGRRARLGQRVDPSKDKVQVDGSTVPLQVDLVHYLLNKPEGYVTTADDERGRPTVLDLVDPDLRLWPVGRLDMATEGALILTNDGELTHRLTHPSFEIPKTYLAEVEGHVGPAVLGRLRRGIELDDGVTAPAKAQVVGQSPTHTLVELVVTEGRNRLVRRMFEDVGNPVRRLARTAIGPLAVGRLKPGSVRKLAPAEVRELYRACGL